MKFIQAQIYGFGKWVDYTVKLNYASFVSFYGENESGKTTLQQFILYVLFGLPPRKLATFQPINSNKIGGMLVVEDDEIGRISIERVDQKVYCYLPSGDKEDEQWLQARLKGLNRHTFTSIYAFSAIDLSEIRQMKKTQLIDVLFSVGLIGSTNIYEAEKKLAAKIGHLFKKQGKRPLINEQMKQTNMSHHHLIEMQQKEILYENKQKEITECKQKKSNLDKTATELEATLLKEEKIQTLLPQLHQYQQYEKQLHDLPENIVFPENGVERLEKGKEKLLPLKSELLALENRLKQDMLEKQENEQALYEEEIIEFATDVVEQKSTYHHLVERQNSLHIE